jgi:hypothetical protein
MISYCDIMYMIYDKPYTFLMYMENGKNITSDVNRFTDKNKLKFKRSQ